MRFKGRLGVIMVSSTSNADRYENPTWEDLKEEEPKEGMCRNCIHNVPIMLDGKQYRLCVQERDDRKAHQFGEVYECDPEVTECADWDWNGEWE